MSKTKDIVLEAIRQSPKTRKNLTSELSLSNTSIDTALRELVKEGKITYQIKDFREQRPSGMQNFVKQSNPKVREYSVILAKMIF